MKGVLLRKKQRASKSASKSMIARPRAIIKADWSKRYTKKELVED